MTRRVLALSLCALGFYALFFGMLYAREQMALRLDHWGRTAETLGIGLAGMRVSYLPPRLELAELRLPLRAVAADGERPDLGLILRDLRLDLLFFPPRLAARARLADGTMRLEVTPSGLVRPESCVLRAELENLPLAECGRALGGDFPLLRIRAGRLAGSCRATLSLGDGGPAWVRSEGEASLNVRGMAVEHPLPMLRAARLDGLNGGMELAWKRNRLQVRRCSLGNDLLSAAVEGEAALAPELPESRPDLRVVLRMGPEQLREDLTPARTFQAFKTRGEVRLRINGSARHPSVDLQS